MRERVRRGRGDRHRRVGGGNRGLHGVANMCRDRSRGASGGQARAGIAEGSVIGATEPIDGAIGASGAEIARRGGRFTVSCNEAVAGRGWGTVSCDGAGSDRGVA